jgi:predicted nucleotidyltransferase
MQQIIHRKAAKGKQSIPKKITRMSAIKIAEQFVGDVVKSGVKIRKAFLYGSYAKNQQRDWSDIDIALVADDFSGISFVDMNSFKKVIIREEYIPIQLKTYSTLDFKKDSFAREEIKNSIKIKA